jgi:hypothetical protein
MRARPSVRRGDRRHAAAAARVTTPVSARLLSNTACSAEQFWAGIAALRNIREVARDIRVATDTAAKCALRQRVATAVHRLHPRAIEGTTPCPLLPAATRRRQRRRVLRRKLHRKRSLMPHQPAATTRQHATVAGRKRRRGSGREATPVSLSTLTPGLSASRRSSRLRKQGLRVED